MKIQMNFDQPHFRFKEKESVQVSIKMQTFDKE